MRFLLKNLEFYLLLLYFCIVILLIILYCVFAYVCDLLIPLIIFH